MTNRHLADGTLCGENKYFSPGSHAGTINHATKLVLFYSDHVVNFLLNPEVVPQ
jgi:hypothetical protein